MILGGFRASPCPSLAVALSILSFYFVSVQGPPGGFVPAGGRAEWSSDDTWGVSLQPLSLSGGCGFLH